MPDLPDWMVPGPPPPSPGEAADLWLWKQKALVRLDVIDSLIMGIVVVAVDPPGWTEARGDLTREVEHLAITLERTARSLRSKIAQVE